MGLTRLISTTTTHRLTSAPRLLRANIFAARRVPFRTWHRKQTPTELAQLTWCSQGIPATSLPWIILHLPSMRLSSTTMLPGAGLDALTSRPISICVSARARLHFQSLWLGPPVDPKCQTLWSLRMGRIGHH